DAAADHSAARRVDADWHDGPSGGPGISGDVVVVDGRAGVAGGVDAAQDVEMAVDDTVARPPNARGQGGEGSPGVSDGFVAPDTRLRGRAGQTGPAPGDIDHPVGVAAPREALAWGEHRRAGGPGAGGYIIDAGDVERVARIIGPAEDVDLVH